MNYHNNRCGTIVRGGVGDRVHLSLSGKTSPSTVIIESEASLIYLYLRRLNNICVMNDST